jgi:hypothetical protein
MSVGMCFGMSLGVLIATVFNITNLGIGALVGLTIGAIIGMCIKKK